ncbi:MAG: hypothetical protein P8M80_08200 [Pirellulaceae bacterium]|nr:hypothetical protein [Pirellulaceae bacterium]
MAIYLNSDVIVSIPVAGNVRFDRSGKLRMQVQQKTSQAFMLILVVASTTLFSGCVPWAKGLRSVDQSVTDWRDFVWGKRAFFTRYDRSHSKPFQDGFMEGYHDLLQGGDGCVPVVAPKRYWSWKYQSSGGQTSITDWFEGYRAGVTAAKEDGLANLSKIPIASNYTLVNEEIIQQVPIVKSGTYSTPIPKLTPVSSPRAPTANIGVPQQKPAATSSSMQKKNSSLWIRPSMPSLIRPASYEGSPARASKIPAITLNAKGKPERPKLAVRLSSSESATPSSTKVKTSILEATPTNQASANLKMESRDTAPMSKNLKGNDSESGSKPLSSLPPILPAMTKEPLPLPSSASTIPR